MEEWRDIENYEGLYQVSSEGRVKSLNYNHTGEERVLKSAYRGNGYLFVVLYKDGKSKMYNVHRLVASAFLDNPDNLPQVNHKDEDKKNNNVDNLEWVTQEYNLNYGSRNERISKTTKGISRPWVAEALTNRTDLSIPVDMLTKGDELMRTFQSSHEAMRWLRDNGYPSASHCHINHCCKGKLQSCYGFKWRYSTGN